MNAKTAPEFLQMHVRSITRMAGLGHIPAHPIGYGQGKSWLFYISGLDESTRNGASHNLAVRRLRSCAALLEPQFQARSQPRGLRFP